MTGFKLYTICSSLSYTDDPPNCFEPTVADETVLVC